MKTVEKNQQLENGLNDNKSLKNKKTESIITKVKNKIYGGKFLKIIILILLILWVIFSTGYIIYDQFQKYVFKQMQSAYQKGVIDSVRAIMNQSNNCQKVTLFDGNKKIDLIDASCQR